MSISVGLKGRCETVVAQENTAAAVGSGLLPVFATPMMVGLMENAAVNAVSDHLAEGEGTVGTHLDVSHDAATPIGMKVWAESEVTEVDGKRIELKVWAYDEKGLIGQGTHQRFIVTNERFLAKTARKLEG